MVHDGAWHHTCITNKYWVFYLKEKSFAMDGWNSFGGRDRQSPSSVRHEEVANSLFRAPKVC
jgi:hypothetical protein